MHTYARWAVALGFLLRCVCFEARVAESAPRKGFPCDLGGHSLQGWAVISNEVLGIKLLNNETRVKREKIEMGIKMNREGRKCL